MNGKEGLLLLCRYLFLLVLALGNLAVIYVIFTPLTIYPVYGFLLSASSSTALLPDGVTLYFRGEHIQLVEACIAGSAYYLLLILNLATPMSPKKRTKSLIFLLASFLILNILRIVIFAGLHVIGYKYFDLAHMFVWYFGSTILVVLIWFANTFLFKIEGIPLYTDLMNVVHDIATPKKSEKKVVNAREKSRSLDRN